MATRGRVRTADIVQLVRHLDTLLCAGLPLAKALRTVARQIEGERLCAVVNQLADDVGAGQMLSSAMAARGDIFDSMTVGVVRAGEASGTLPQALGQLANGMEKKAALQRMVAGAMIYPTIVLIIAIAVVSFLLLFVVPAFKDVYDKMNVQLPLVTRLLLWASQGVAHYWWALAGVAAGFLVAWKPMKRVESFQRWSERLMLHLPLLGKVRRKALASRFLGAFATLIGSGLSIIESLRLLGELMDNRTMSEAIMNIRRHVSRGGRMSEPMARYRDLFSPMAIQMIAVGEQTGSLPEAATRMADFLSQDVEHRVKAMVMLLEPLLTVGLGVIVGIIALAIYLPMFDLMKHISR